MSEQEKSNGDRKLTAYERWELPHLHNDNPRVDSGPAILIQKDAVVTIEEIDEDELVYEPLTASQLEEIRSAAYDEGFIQGEEEGHKKGHEDGFAKGEAEGIEKGHAEGYKTGTQEAHEEVKAEAKIQFETLETLLSNVVKEIAQPLAESRDAAENILYQTMVRMIENICLSKMNEDGQDVLKKQLERVFEEIGEFEGRIRLNIHPDDFAVVENLGVKERLDLQIEPNDTLTSGDFVLDSKSFHIDGRIEQRLKTVFDELHNLTLPDQS